MKRDHIAAQLYTVRKHTQTQKDFARTIHILKSIGYTTFELSGVGPLEAQAIRRILDDEGVTLCATHEPEDLLFGETERVVERLQILGCRYAVFSWPGERRRFDDLSTVLSLAESLNRAGECLARSGFHLLYHHHHMELTRLGERTALDILFGATDPQFLGAELDTYWLQYGGANPAAWCRKMGGRLRVLHLKDYAVTPDRRIAFAEVGAGNLDWDEILSAAEEGGCEWFAVEQDECASDPFVSLQRSYDYLVAKAQTV